MTAKKQITIDVPDGLPDGWECCGYGLPKKGLHFLNPAGEWHKASMDFTGESYLLARRIETAADWANRQPKLGNLASMLDDHRSLSLSVFSRHILENGMAFNAEKCSDDHDGKRIVSKSGKWVNA